MLSRIKTWIAEVLTYSDLNAEFDNIINNGAGSLSSPRTANFDIDGYQLILDSAATAYVQAGTQNIIDFYGSSTLLFRFDMSVSTPVNALSFVAAAASSSPDIVARGSDANIGIRLQPKGSGKLTIDGAVNWIDGGGTADAITATYAPAITALDDGLTCFVRATAANATTTPTFAPNGLTAKTIVKRANTALVAGDIVGDSHELILRYASDIDKWVLLNPRDKNDYDLNDLTTDSTGGALADLIPFVDASESNANNKVRVDNFFSQAMTACTDTTPTGSTLSGYEVMARKSADGTLHKIAISEIPIGKQTIWIPAGAMIARTTNGAAPGTTESATNKIMSKTLDFDQSTDEFAQFTISFPKGWNESTVTAQFVWASGVTGNVVWGLQGVALSDDDVIDTAFGTAQIVTDAVTAITDVMVSAETSAITIAGTPAEGDTCWFQVYRDADNGSDTAAGDAKLLGVRVFFTTNANTDD